MNYIEQRNIALKDRNQRVMEQSLVYVCKESRIKNFFRTSIQVECRNNEFDIDMLNQAIKDVNQADIGKPKRDDDLNYCSKISDELFQRLANHFVDSDIKITTTESSGGAITKHYRSYKPSLTIKI
jgi:LPS O-antigen subunit length determinant protein (WzzB/FepE family)